MATPSSQGNWEMWFLFQKTTTLAKNLGYITKEDEGNW